MDSLNDQIAVVTAASSGIGKAIALSLAGNSWMMLRSKCTRSGRAATLVRRTSPTMTTSAAQASGFRKNLAM